MWTVPPNGRLHITVFKITWHYGKQQLVLNWQPTLWNGINGNGMNHNKPAARYLFFCRNSDIFIASTLHQNKFPKTYPPPPLFWKGTIDVSFALCTAQDNCHYFKRIQTSTLGAARPSSSADTAQNGIICRLPPVLSHVQWLVNNITLCLYIS